MASPILLVAVLLLIGPHRWGSNQVSAASVGVFQTNDTSRPRLLGIVGGTEVVAHSHPYLVVLNLFSSSGGIFCGGTLITTKRVLTAAHCFDHNPTRIVVYLGRHDISASESGVQQKMTSRSYVVHSGWDSSTLRNDLALVTLPSAATLNDYVQTVKIDAGTTDLEGQTGTIVGWGLTETGTQSYQLRSVDVGIISDDVCNAAYSQATSTNVCTSGDGTKGGCTGDSGGPLLVDGKQVGIMSFGSSNCTASLPSVFARLSSYYDWLNTNVGDSTIFSS